MAKEDLRMSNNKSNMQILRELSEKYHNGDFSDEEREKMKQWTKYLMKIWMKLNQKLTKKLPDNGMRN